MKNNVPFDVAFSLDFTEVQGWAIICGQLEGGKWNWNSLEWEKPE